VADQTHAVPVRNVGEPKTTTATEIAMVVKSGLPITVGYNAEKAFQLFHDQNGFETDKLPARFDFPYRCRAWDAPKFGFGEITYDGTLVAAMFQEDRFTQDRVDDIVKAHREKMPNITPTLIGGKNVKYWFWEKDDQRLMVCEYLAGKDPIKLTVAMGDDVVMDALGISVGKAMRDSTVVDTDLATKPVMSTPGTPVGH